MHGLPDRTPPIEGETPPNWRALNFSGRDEIGMSVLGRAPTKLLSICTSRGDACR